MIQPVSALTPKVSFRGEKVFSASSDTGKYKRRFAYARNLFGALAIGTLVTMLTRTYTSNWAHSGIYGAMGCAAALMIFAPGSRLNTNTEASVLLKEADIGIGRKALADSALQKKGLGKRMLRVLA